MPNQPRTFFDSKTLDELAASIQSYGIISPLLVTQMDQGNYCLIAGERRWRAAKQVGLKSAPCIIRIPNEHQNLEISLIENIQREDLNCFEEAECYFRLIDQHGFSHEALSVKLGKSRSQISNALRLLLLPLTIKSAVISNEISPGHARCLCGLESEIEQIQLKNLIISKKLSVRQTEDLVKKRKKETDQNPQKLTSTKTSESVRYVSEQLKSYLGTKVKILGDSEKGRIEISYYTLEDFQRIYELVVREQR
jgi:ParB family chromosome partitioning protein